MVCLWIFVDSLVCVGLCFVGCLRRFGSAATFMFVFGRL